MVWSIKRKPDRLEKLALAFIAGLFTSISLAQPAQSVEGRSVDSRLEKIVRVQKSESFNSIAARELGSVGLGRLLAEYNQLSIDSPLTEGLELIIPTHLEPKRNFASVAFVKGKAELRVAGSLSTVRPVAVDDKIYTTDVIVTGKNDFVSLQLANGTVFNVQPTSEVSLKTLQCLAEDSTCDVGLESAAGSVTADVEKRDGQQNRFLISTPYASAAVRGTVFDFSATDQQMLVGVTEGEVEIEADAVTASLPTGFGSVAEVASAPSAPIPLLKAPSFFSAPERFSSEDALIWAPSEGAEQYQLSLASDAAGQAEIFRQSVSGLRHAFDDAVFSLPQGELHAILRPIDQLGLKGFRGQQTLNVVELDETLPRPALSFDRTADSDFVFVPSDDDSAENTHEVQFSTTRDFAEMVSVDIPQSGGTQHTRNSEQAWFARARVLVDNNVVGGYGEILEIPAPD